MFTIETKRLRLRELNLNDDKFLYDIRHLTILTEYEKAFKDP
jgi:hypothetical protein